MVRKLNEVEKKAVKNLQVSNSIYRKEIKVLSEQLVALDVELTELKLLAADQLGEALAQTDVLIVQAESDLKSIAGKIAYKEGRIAAKEEELAQIQNKASREEEEVLESYDPNDPDLVAKKQERAAKAAQDKADFEAKKAADKAAKKAARDAKKAAEAQPTTEEF